MGGIGGEQPMQCGGPGTRQPGDEDRPGDRHVDVAGVGLPRRLAQQPRHQRPLEEVPEHLAAEFGEPGLFGVRGEQDRQRLAVPVIAEIIQTGCPHG